MATQTVNLSPEQVHDLLGCIASRAMTLRDLAMTWAEGAGVSEQGTQFHAVQAMAELIGALADAGIGGDFCGSTAAWSAGSTFQGGQQ